MGGLVDYSDSEESSTESAPVAKSPPPPSSSSASKTASKKPAFQKVVDRTNPGKILINLPQETSTEDLPPSKRVKTEGSSASGGLFAGFNSFLPPPKNAGKSVLSNAAAGKTRPGINLKTSAEPGFSREEVFSAPSAAKDNDTESGSGALVLPPPKQASAPTIPEAMKSEEEVKLVGKPLAFKPLSVSRPNAARKKLPRSAPTKPAPAKPASVVTPVASATKASQATTAPSSVPDEPIAAPVAKKTPLFSLHAEESYEPVAPMEPIATEQQRPPVYPPATARNPYGAYYGNSTNAYGANSTNAYGVNSGHPYGYSTGYANSTHPYGHGAGYANPSHTGYANSYAASHTNAAGPNGTTYANPANSYTSPSYQGWYNQNYNAGPPPIPQMERQGGPQTLQNMAADLNLTPAQRRDLFGRQNSSSAATPGSSVPAQTIVNVNMDREYEHNEQLRQSGAQQPAHNPVRAIQGGGKHSLRQLVQNASNQKEALEESFAQGKSSRKESSGRYGW